MGPLVKQRTFNPLQKDTLSVLLMDLSKQSQQIEQALTNKVNQKINDSLQKQYDQIIVVKTYVRNLCKMEKSSTMKEVMR